ncbi:MAG: acyltransferase [Cognatishimia sp.]|uniref:acyltransferase n=1 Tax=Cognatishimia sp. TaxID=2211648 RepID=UPI003B8D6372
MNDQRMVWLDCLRLIAGLSMVGLHSTADPMGLPWVNYEPVERVIPLALRSLFYTARTELFLMISMFLLLLSLDRRSRGYVETLREQAKRLLIPFLFWTFFFAIFGLIKATQFGYLSDAKAQLIDPLSWLGFLVLGDVKYHMHFLPTLFCLLLFYPVFKLAVTYPVLGVLVIFFLLARRELDGFVYAQFWGTEGLGYLTRLIKVLTYVGYGLIAGAAVGIWQKTSKENLSQWCPLILLCSVILFLFKLIATIKTIQTGAWQFSYLPGYWADFLMPALLFCGCLVLGHKSWPSSVSKWAKFSFGIYLCHPIFLDLCEIVLRPFDSSPTVQVSSKILLVLPASYLLVRQLSQSKHLAWTVGLGPFPKFNGLFSQTRRLQ